MNRRSRRVLVAGCLVLAVAATVELLTGMVGGRLGANRQSLVETPLQLLLAGALVGAGILSLWADHRRSSAIPSMVGDRHPPERPRNAPTVLGERFDAELSETIQDIRLNETDFDRTAIRQSLRNLLHRAIKQGRTCSDDRATAVIETGDWTDDAVAAAFLGNPPEPPPRFQLFAWARPTAAYEHAIERTSLALDAFVATTETGRRSRELTPADELAPTARTRSPRERAVTDDTDAGGAQPAPPAVGE